MAVPKRKHSKGRTRRKRNAHYKKVAVTNLRTKNKKTYKRPHIEEDVEV